MKDYALKGFSMAAIGIMSSVFGVAGGATALALTNDLHAVATFGSIILGGAVGYGATYLAANNLKIDGKSLLSRTLS